MFLYVLVVVILILYPFLRLKKRPPNYPKGPPRLPLIGNLHQVGLDPHVKYCGIGKKYGGIFAFDFGAQETVVITDHKLLRQMFATPAFMGRPQLQVLLDRCGKGSTYCRGIISSEHRHSSEQRRFVFRNLRDYENAKPVQDIIQEEVCEFLEIMQKDIGKPVKGKYLFTPAILNSVWRFFTGLRTYQTDPQIKRLGSICETSTQMYVYAGISFAFPILTEWFPNVTGYNTIIGFSEPLCNFLMEELMAHKDTFVPGQARNIMDAIWDEINSTTDPESSFYQEEGVKNAIKSLEDIFVGGSDSLSGSINWLFILMCLHPEVQEKVHEEVIRVVGPSRFPALTDRINMPIAESAIMEMLRLVVPLPLGVMHKTAEDVHFAGYDIPKDTIIVTDIYAALHDEEVWGDPEVYRPGRFINEDGTLNKSIEAFFPFALGKRSCVAEKLIREEQFLFLTGILQKFRVEFHGPKPSLKCNTGLILAPPYHELVFHEREL